MSELNIVDSTYFYFLIFIFISIYFLFSNLELKISIISQTVIYHSHNLWSHNHILQKIVKGSRTMVSYNMLIICNICSLG